MCSIAVPLLVALIDGRPELPPASHYVALNSTDAQALWNRHANGELDAKVMWGDKTSGVFITRLEASAKAHERAPDEAVVHVSELQYGWPMRGLYGGWIMTLTPGRNDYTVKMDGLKMIGGANGRLIPVRPLWGGLLINALAYGGISWIVLTGGMWARKERRRRLNRCIACGYQIGQSTRCSECGADLLPKS